MALQTVMLKVLKFLTKLGMRSMGDADMWLSPMFLFIEPIPHDNYHLHIFVENDLMNHEPRFISFSLFLSLFRMCRGMKAFASPLLASVFSKILR